MTRDCQTAHGDIQPSQNLAIEPYQAVRDLAEIHSNVQPLLWQFDPNGKVWRQIRWPDELADFRELMARHAGDALSEEDVRRWSPQERRFLFPFCIFAAAPAFAIPVAVESSRIATERDGLAGIQSGWEKVRLCLVVCLDKDYLTRDVLPGLAVQHLSTDGEVQYDYLVRTRQRPQQVLLASPEKYQEDLITAPDASVTLLQLRLEESPGHEKLRQLEEALRGPIHTVPGGTGRAGSLVEREAQATRIQTQIPGGTSLDPERIRVEEGLQLDRQARREALPHQTDGLRRIMETQAANGWQLLVRHRAGSLQAAVTRVRQRNLYVGFGILLVLATSLVVFAIAVRRAQQLAKQQVEFVASISHELRTPVTAICSLSENLADGLVRPEEQVQRYGQFILREGRRLGGLVEQALEFAGISSGRQRNRMQCIPVAPVVRAALQSCEAQLQEGHAKVETQIEPNLPQIVADGESLSCAIQNLISNAIKYSPGGVDIRVQAKYSSEHRRLEISIADRGIGISQDEMKRIFEPFFRGRNALDSQIRGAGIGLSLVKRIMDAHNGRIVVSSRPGRGTCVSLFLPAEGWDSQGDDRINTEFTPRDAGDCHGKDTGG